MRKLLFLLITLCAFFYAQKSHGQQFADKEFYLIDSLVLDDLTAVDRGMVDSCMTLYHAAKSDTDRINALHFICENMMHENWERYQDFQHNLLQELVKKEQPTAVKKNLLTAYAGSLNNLGFICNQKGQIDEAIVYFKEAQKIQKELNDIYGWAVGLQNLGNIYFNQGKIEEALKTYGLSLKLYEQIGNKKGIADAFLNLGTIHDNQGNTDEAMDYYTRSLEMKKEIGDLDGTAICLNNLGYLFYNMGKHDKAIENFEESLAIYTKIGSKIGMALAYQQIGFMYKKDDPQKTLTYYDKSLELRMEIGDKKGMVLTYLNFGRVYMSLNQLDKAEENTLKALELSKSLGFPFDIRNCAQALVDIYKKQKKGTKALEMFELYIHMRDSINNEETKKASLKQQVQYEFEKQKVLDDAEHDKLIAIEQEAKKKQKVLTYASLIGLVLVVAFLLFVFNRLKITRKQKLIIEESHIELAEKNKEILDSISYAKRIQSAILPTDEVVKEHLKESFILYQPKDIVAGDFYWIEHKDGETLFAAADCTGHGVPGAMVSVICNNALNRSVREHGLLIPGAILDKSREIVIQEFEKSHEEVKDGMDIALCSLKGMSLQYAGANNPLWIIRNGEILETKANKQPIGKFRAAEPFVTHEFELQSGDSIYLFSDGYVDQFGGEKGKKFKSNSFKALLLRIQDQSMEEQKQLLSETFAEWKGDLEQIDDVCVIGVRV